MSIVPDCEGAHDAALASSSKPAPARISELVAKAAELLPSQGPITAFAFLNTLQGLEDRPFDDGLVEGAHLFGCQPYLPESKFREHLARGRITADDLLAAVSRDLGPDKAAEPIAGLVSRGELRLKMLEHPIYNGPPAELRWYIAETDALKRIRVDVSPDIRRQFLEATERWTLRDLRADGEATHHTARGFCADLMTHFGESTIEDWSAGVWEEFSLQLLWRIARQGVHQVHQHHEQRAREHRLDNPDDLMRQVAGASPSEAANDILIPYCAGFLDQGLAAWPLPVRQLGFYRGFLRLFGRAAGPSPLHRALASEFDRLDRGNVDVSDCIVQSLQQMGISPEEERPFLVRSLLALRGWAGMLWQAEARGDRIPRPAPPGTLVDYLAVRLVIERVALVVLARSHLGLKDSPVGIIEHLRRHRLPQEPVGVEQRAFLVFQLAQLFGWSAERLHQLSGTQWSQLLEELHVFGSLARRRCFQHAFERRLRNAALQAIATHREESGPEADVPVFQAMFCIDAREESFRRHLEETEPRCQTFGVAGFFGVPIYYRGIHDAHFATLCPIVVRPKHWLVEEVLLTDEERHQRRTRSRRVLGQASLQVQQGSHGLIAGAILTAGFGVLASIPLVARVLFPQLAASIRSAANRFVEAPPQTRLHIERIAESPSPLPDGIGFNVEEMAGFCERLLRDIGLTEGFSRLVFVVGHGSSCLNNPHKSCYDCGACSGSAGGPNGRAVAMMMNDPRVRALLNERGIAIPEQTRFVGAQHDTAVDAVQFFDLDLLPGTHRNDLQTARATLNEACERNAHERCRRFYSAPLNLSPAAAHRHVRERSEDMAQTRPEFGNATNAYCIVGRRQLTRGLFLDRRSFLVSYDPLSDDERLTILERILSAVVPVCEGINLQYTLAAIDPAGWGSGTKLPHNVTSLLGVMDGARSDLRPGLPWQGVEIHEPVRLLFVVEATIAGIEQILARNAAIARIVVNGWVQFAVRDPRDASLHYLSRGRFVPFQPQAIPLPVVRTSRDWYRGSRDHLEFAEIRPDGSTETSQPANKAEFWQAVNRQTLTGEEFVRTT